MAVVISAHHRVWKLDAVYLGQPANRSEFDFTAQIR
jgi:hypothetical protein